MTLLLALAAFIVVEVFTVEQVEVEGNEWYSATQIEEMVLNDEYSWNSLYVTLKYRLIEIGEVPFVDAMEVSLDDPHTVRIKVYEKGILGYLYIPVLGQNAYFDKDGFVVETSTNIIPDVPKVTGVKCDEVVLYEKLQLEDESILRLLLNLTQTLKKYKLEPDEIAFDDKEGAIVYYGTIPNGAGLSSSASIEVLTGFVLKDLFNLDLDMVKLALLGQKAENQYIGVNCGIMDQFIIANGKKDCAVFLDTASLEFEYAPVILSDAKIVIMNTNKKRGLGDSKYNERRAECEKALEELQEKLDIKSLGELTEKEFLANYQPRKYKQPSVTADIVVMQKMEKLKILLCCMLHIICRNVFL